MLIKFDEELDLPVADVYPYFRTPQDWPRLYGAFGEVEERGEVARVARDESLSAASWEFGGAWRGQGEVRFTPTPGGVAVRGYEDITLRPFGWLAPTVERIFLEPRFRKVWESGWRRLRRQAAGRAGAATVASR